WIFCDVVYRDGTPIAFSSRAVLQNAIDRLADAGMAATIGLEVEFHVFQRVDPSLNHVDTTMPGTPPETRALAQGYQFLTENRYGEVESVLDDLRRAAQGLGLPVRSVEIEMGPSQFEFTFDPAPAMDHADNLMMFRTMVKQVCATKGLHASFMTKPRLPNIAACGWHIHQSLSDIKTGTSLMIPDTPGALTPQASGWIAGLLTHAAASSLLTVPTVNGYKRYQPYQLAPNRIQWGQDNRGAMIRALMAPGDPASRVENRAPDTTANPYFALAAQLICGLDGIASGLTAPAPTLTPYEGEAEMLPATLAEAMDAFDQSALYRQVLGDETVDYLLQIKRFEWNRYLSAISEWEQAEYFSLF
ncbi:MAG: glutamine synthetase, partial [Paracoccaceae bacterium]